MSSALISRVGVGPRPHEEIYLPEMLNETLYNITNYLGLKITQTISLWAALFLNSPHMKRKAWLVPRMRRGEGAGGKRSMPASSLDMQGSYGNEDTRYFLQRVQPLRKLISKR